MLIHQEPFRIRGNETGPDLKMSFPAVASFIQEAAWMHSIKLGVSVYDLLKRGMTWVLSRVTIELESRLKHSDLLNVITWPSGFNRHYIFRDYHFQDASGALIGKAKTVWVILDLKSRQPVEAPSFITDVPLQQEIPILPVNTERIPATDAYPYAKDFTAGWHDIDINRHVNNLSYMRWVIESIPLEILKTRDISKLDIVFRAESGFGDRIEALTKNEDEPWTSALHKLQLKDSGKELVLARSTWR